jgi:hypothetical protein
MQPLRLIAVRGRRLHLLADCYNGYTPTGRYYQDKVDYVSVDAQ